VRYQQNEYSCGPASVQNALIVLGERPSQAKLALIAGTTEADGTDEDGVVRAILAAGYQADVVATSDPRKAWAHLVYSLMVGRPLVLCTARWGHWICAVGTCGKRIIVADPARLPNLMRENGIVVMNRDRLLKLWAAARRVRGKGPKYYGVAVGPG
jgi:predicted double-glycine peptidase